MSKNLSCWQLHITADKREIKDSSKLPSATLHIRGTLDEIVDYG